MEAYNHARHVYCLSISLVDATGSEPENPPARQDRFSVLLAEELKSHIENLGLVDVSLKFTGNGWLMMTAKEEQITALACLATIIVEKFQESIAQATGVARDRVPSVRAVICSGHGRFIELPDGRKDWIGDSPRKAARLSMYCHPNKVLLDGTVHDYVAGDFEVAPVDFKPELSGTGMGDVDSPLYSLEGPRLEASGAVKDPARFIYTFGAIGKGEEIATSSKKLVELLAGESKHLAVDDMDGRDNKEKQKSLGRWNRIMASLPDYASALELFEAMRGAGLSPDIAAYNVLVAKSDDYEIASSWLEVMQNEKIKPDISTFNALIVKAAGSGIVKILLEKMRSEDVKPDANTYSALIQKSSDYAAAKSLFEMMQNEGVRANLSIYNALISKAPDYDVAKSLLEIMVAEGIQPDLVSYNALISKASEYELAKFWLEAMMEEAIQPNLAAYNRLISKVSDYDKAKTLLESMQEEGIKPNILTYNTLITKAPSYEIAENLLGAMRDEGVKPNTDSYVRLFSKNLAGRPADEVLKWYLSQEFDSDEPIQAAISSYRRIGRIDQALRLAVEYPQLPVSRKLIREIMDEVFSYLEVIREEGVKTDVKSYNVLIAKAPDFDTAKSWLDAMKKEDVQPDGATYKNLITKAPDFDTAKSLVEAMSKDGISVDVDTYNLLFGKNLSGKSADEILGWYLVQEYHPDEPVQVAIESFREAGLPGQSLRLALEYSHLEAARKMIKEYMDEVLSYMETIQEEGVCPSVVAYSALIAKAPYYSIAESLLDTMRKKGVKPNVVTYNTLISKAPDFDTAKSWLKEMLEDDIDPSVVTYSSLISKTPDYNTAEKLFDSMQNQGIKPNVVTYNALILKASDYKTIKSLLDVMQKEGIKPDTNSYNALVSKAPDYDTAKSLVEFMYKEGIRPNLVTYNRLFSKNLSGKRAEDILSWYRAQNYCPDEPIQAAVANYRKLGLIDDALRLATEYPHLQVAQKVVKEHMEKALS